MPTTTNFGWTTPADTDLVKDGASAMRTLGNGIDTSLVYLKGGTTGQILSKTSNTDLAFTWINNDQGDITAVTAGTGLSGGGTSGAVSLAIDTATTVDKTTAQTLTNKTLTAPIISSISNTGTLTLPTSTDTLVGRATTDTLTNKTISGSSNTISNVSLTTGVTGTLPIGNGGTNLSTYTTGDLPYASASNTLSKLAIGSSGNVLTVSGGVPTWAAPAGGSALTLITAQSLSASSVSVSNVFSSTYQNYKVLINVTNVGSGCNIRIRLRNGSGDSSTNYNVQKFQMYGSTSSAFKQSSTDMWQPTNADPAQCLISFEIMRPYDADKTWIWGMGVTSDASTNALTELSGVYKNDSTSYDGFTIYSHNGTTITGTARVYGVKDS